MLLRAAIRADSSYFLPYDLYIREMVALVRLDPLAREFPEPPRTASVLAQCVSAAARFQQGYDWATLTAVLARLDSLPDPSGCRASVGARQRYPTTPDHSLAEVREALSREPESDNTLWIKYAALLNALEKREDAAAALLEGIRRSPHPVQSVALQVQLAAQKELMGDSAGARGLRAAIGASVARDGRPYLRWYHLQYLANSARTAGDIALFGSLNRERTEVAHKSGAAVAEFYSYLDLGDTRYGIENDAKASIAPFTHAIALAERLGVHDLIKVSYMSRGRSYAKLGDARRAEPDLRKALVATASGDAYNLGDAHHILAHLYEGLGRWADAVREIDLYRDYTRPPRAEMTSYMMSLHDGATIRWKAGWHAAAKEEFEEMVRVTEKLKEHYVFAGDYYERIGDYARALDYYRRDAALKHLDDRPRYLAGLTRMYEALGMRDSARAAAELHDQPAYNRGTSRLLPAVLLANGKVEDGLRLARKNVEEQELKESALGVATATIQLARLYLEAGRSKESAREGAKAERLALKANLTDEAIEAILVQGEAQLREQSHESISTLLRARAVVRAHPTATAALKVESALGDAYAALGRPTDALIAYDRAARTSQQITVSYEEALDRARHREQRIAVFDGALRVLLGMPESQNRVEQLLSWSARKKDAVMNHGDTGGAAAQSGTKLADVQRALGGGTAVVDYVAVDSGLFALVVTNRESRVVKLPMSVSVASDLAQRLRRPFLAVSAGQLDLARAPFDLGVAHQLYAGLFAPLEKALEGVQRIVVVPDGPLYAVPFDALPRAFSGAPGVANAYHRAEYLIDRFNITLATSPALARVETSRGVPAGARLLVVRGQVAGGEREVAAIGAAWPAGLATSLGGSAATEAVLRREAGSRSVIHFAVHARADENDPLASYLELARDSSDDGFLHVTEVAALKFRGELVVLTGCETMPGRLYAGTGPFGIANSFIAAGARNVIATQWPVGESAAELSRDLYRALASGAEASDALRAAQLKLRRDPARTHPFYWGGYVLVAGRRGSSSGMASRPQ